MLSAIKLTDCSQKFNRITHSFTCLATAVLNSEHTESESFAFTELSACLEILGGGQFEGSG